MHKAQILALLLVLTTSALCLGAAPAGAADTPLPNAAEESRARDLMREVRCVVCQSQSIGESDAGIAVDLRRLIREEIAAGKSDDEIRRFLVDRYGDYILFTPPFKTETLVLWLGPFAVLAGGLLFVIRFLRRRPAQLSVAALSEDESRRVSQALETDAGNGSDGAGNSRGDRA